MKKVRCPICGGAMPGAETDWPERPFCSRRCRQIDLGRWLGEDYRIPASPSDDEASSSSDPASPS
jgi:uncharacterized protein